jgi:hypothetical protein
MTNGRTYIATPASTKILKQADKDHKAGIEVDWEKVFKDVDEASAKGLNAQLKAIVEMK